MNTRILAAALAASAAAGWLARCELDRRRLAASPRLDAALREALSREVPGRNRWLTHAVGVIRARLDSGETAEAVSVSARAADGGLATYTMRAHWTVPVVTFGTAATAKEKRQ